MNRPMECADCHVTPEVFFGGLRDATYCNAQAKCAVGQMPPPEPRMREEQRVPGAILLICIVAAAVSVFRNWFERKV